MSIRSSEEYEEQGLRMLRAEQAAEALRVFEEGICRFPGDVDLAMGAAIAHLRLGNLARSCEILEGLRRERPGSVEILQALAEAYLSRGLVAEAVRSARDAARQRPLDADLLTRLGRIFYDRRRYVEALPFYDLASRTSPDWSEAWFGLGACQWALRRTVEAEAALHRAIELDPKDWQARQFLGCVLCDTGRKKEAAEMFKTIPLDVLWQKPALERMIAMLWWPEDAERHRQMEKLWRRTIDGAAAGDILDAMEDASRKMGPL